MRGAFLECDIPGELRGIPQQLPGTASLPRRCSRLFPLFPFSAQELCFISKRVQPGSSWLWQWQGMFVTHSSQQVWAEGLVSRTPRP